MRTSSQSIYLSQKDRFIAKKDEYGYYIQVCGEHGNLTLAFDTPETWEMFGRVIKEEGDV